MNDDASTPNSTPRETLTGDRACSHCMHPLVGCAIVREPTTGLLYVRCVECGAANALMEYPVATPWVHRMKTVVATSLVASAIALTLILAGIAGGFSTGAAMSGATVSAESVFDAFTMENPPAPNAQSVGVWDTANTAWLNSPAGESAIAKSRWSFETLIPFGVILGLGSIAAVPFALFLGMLGLRWRAQTRALLVLTPIVLGWVLIAGPARLFVSAGRMQANWSDTVAELNYMHFAVITLCSFCVVGAISAVAAPSLAALVFRAILPPRDRRLVAWIWEWRGKPVPRD